MGLVIPPVKIRKEVVVPTKMGRLGEKTILLASLFQNGKLLCIFPRANEEPHQEDRPETEKMVFWPVDFVLLKIDFDHRPRLPTQ